MTIDLNAITRTRIPAKKIINQYKEGRREHLTYAMSINAYVRQKLEHLQLDHKEK